jgi:hypothetical protein
MTMHWIDPESLPATTGTVERFIVNPKGEVDGLVLNDATGAATLVHVPPHLADEITGAIQTGDSIQVHGIRPRGAAVIAAVSLTTADAQTIVDHGPKANSGHQKSPPSVEEPSLKRQPGMEAVGTVRLSLYAPKGELRGALLADGTVLRLGPKEAERWVELLRPGATLAATGEGLCAEYGIVIDVQKIGARLDTVRPVKEHGPPLGRKEDAPQAIATAGDAA